MPFDSQGRYYSTYNDNPPLQPPVSAPKTGEAGWWQTGYGGSKPGWDQTDTFNEAGKNGPWFFPGTPGYDATAGAYQRSEGWFQQAMKRLNQNYLSGPLGNFAQGGFMKPQGWDPNVVAAMKRQSGEIIQGAAADAMQAMNARASATGFGQSMGLIREQDRARANRAQDISNAYTRVDIENELAKAAYQDRMRAMISALLSAQSAQDQYAAQLMANKTEPVIPGITPGTDGEAGTGFKWLGPDGKQKPGTFPHTAGEWQEFIDERLRWEQFYGGKAA